jgi:hypothetical protein
LELTIPVPYQNPIPENPSDTMKRDRQHLTRFFFQLERQLDSLLKMDFGEGDADDSLGGTIQVSDLKIGCSEFSVPADSVQEALYWNHEWTVGILSPPRRSKRFLRLGDEHSSRSWSKVFWPVL